MKARLRIVDEHFGNVRYLFLRGDVWHLTSEGGTPLALTFLVRVEDAMPLRFALEDANTAPEAAEAVRRFVPMATVTVL